MPTQHWKGPIIPSVGDDLVEAWPDAFDTAGIITVAASIAAARTALTAAETAGHPITTTTPVYFDIGGIIYKADGTKNSGVWVMKPFNETELVETASINGDVHTFSAGQVKPLINTAMPVRPYDRAVTLDVFLYGNLLAGSVDLQAAIGTKMKFSSFTSGESTASVTVIGKIPAGASTTLQMAMRGRTAGSKLDLSSATGWNGITATATPITMA